MRSKRLAVLLNLIGVFCFAAGPLGVRLVKDSFPVSFLNFFRYAAALGFLWPYLLLSRSGLSGLRRMGPARAALPKVLAVGSINFLFQLLYSGAVYRIYPGLATLLQKTNVLFSLVLAAALLPEERPLLRDLRFLAAAALAAAGILLIVPGGESAGGGETLAGILMVLASAVCWSVTGALIKRWFAAVPGLLTTVLVETTALPLFLLAFLLPAGAAAVPRPAASAWLLAAASGLITYGIGYQLYYLTIPALGLAGTAVLGMLTPLVAGVFSFLLFREVPGPRELAGAVLLLAGCGLAIRLQLRRPPRPRGVEPAA